MFTIVVDDVKHVVDDVVLLVLTICIFVDNLQHVLFDVFYNCV
jgi:hypothetical protein